jgi:hypothetical protein
MQRGVPFRRQRAAFSNVAGADDRLPGRRPSAKEHPYSENLYRSPTAALYPAPLSSIIAALGDRDDLQPLTCSAASRTPRWLQRCRLPECIAWCDAAGRAPSAASRDQQKCRGRKSGTTASRNFDITPPYRARPERGLRRPSPPATGEPSHHPGLFGSSAATVCRSQKPWLEDPSRPPARDRAGTRSGYSEASSAVPPEPQRLSTQQLGDLSRQI